MWLKAILALGALAAPGAALAADGQTEPTNTGAVQLRESSEAKKNNAFGTAGYYQMRSRTLTVTGLEFNLGFRHARDEKLSFGPRLRQAFASDESYTTLYTGFSMDLDYAVTGRMTLEEGETYEKEQRIFKYRERNTGGFKVTLTMSQFFINTINVAVPFSGPGVGFRYDFPSDGVITITGGAGIDRLTNTEIMLVPFLVYAGLVHIL